MLPELKNFKAILNFITLLNKIRTFQTKWNVYFVITTKFSRIQLANAQQNYKQRYYKNLHFLKLNFSFIFSSSTDTLKDLLSSFIHGSLISMMISALLFLTSIFYF